MPQCPNSPEAIEIKNPISLARLVYDHSTEQLSLRRVPPNLLVAQGATDFAFDNGMPVLPYDALISPTARERWVRWKADLKTAERKAKEHSSLTSPSIPSPPRSDPNQEESVRNKTRQLHTRAMLSGEPLESDPLSPARSDKSPAHGASLPLDLHVSTSRSTPDSHDTSESSDAYYESPAAGPGSLHEASQSAFMNSTQQVPTLPVLQDELEGATVADIDDIAMSDIDDSEDQPWTQPQHYQRRSSQDGSTEEESDQSSDTLQLPSVTPSPPSRLATAAISDTVDLSQRTAQAANPVVEESKSMPPDSQTQLPEDDLITDTVGAIAIDSYGNIACGASSGGIGMKYRGRVGPAALVGVGAAVVPADPDDKFRTTVASVTSGTGEHMATTMAATVCAERVYYGVKKARGGGYESVEDDYALRAMIEQDFMGKRTFGILYG